MNQKIATRIESIKARISRNRAEMQKLKEKYGKKYTQQARWMYLETINNELSETINNLENATVPNK